MNKIRKGIILYILLNIPILAISQIRDSITLDKCYQSAIENSSLDTRKNLTQKIATSERKKIGAAYIPSASINGLASYQSDVTNIPISQVGVEAFGQMYYADLDITSPRKEMYRVTLDIEQLIYDGGTSSKSRDIISSNLIAEKLEIDIERLSLKDRIAKIYLGIELLKRNKEIVLLHMELIKGNIKKLNNLNINGVATKQDIIKLEAELLKQEQYLIEVEINRAKMVDMLSIMINKPLSVDDIYILPSCDIHPSEISKRPEYKLFDTQREILEKQKKLSNIDNMPKISAFATGGNGLPGLDMLSHNPQWYYVAGVKFTMPLTKWRSTKHDIQKFTYQQSIISSKKRDFERDNRVAIASSVREIDKFNELILSDNKIIAKKSESLEIEEHKLENGISTSNDYIIELNSHQAALLLKSLNEIKLIEAVINYKSNIGGN